MLRTIVLPATYISADTPNLSKIMDEYSNELEPLVPLFLLLGPLVLLFLMRGSLVPLFLPLESLVPLFLLLVPLLLLFLFKSIKRNSDGKIISLSVMDTSKIELQHVNRHLIKQQTAISTQNEYDATSRCTSSMSF